MVFFILTFGVYHHTLSARSLEKKIPTESDSKTHLIACAGSLAASFVFNAALFQGALLLNPAGSYAAIPLFLGAVCSPWALKKMYALLYPERKLHDIELHFGDYIGTIFAAMLVREKGSWINKALGGLLLQKFAFIMWQARNLPQVTHETPHYGSVYEDHPADHFQEIGGPVAPLYKQEDSTAEAKAADIQSSSRAEYNNDYDGYWFGGMQPDFRDSFILLAH